MKALKVLILGSGGREHALCQKISSSSFCNKLFVAPGNPGMEDFATRIPISATDFHALADFCDSEGIDFVVVGPEEPLVKGITDFFKKDSRTQNTKVFGPSEKGAMLEGSKDFSKIFMNKHGIPTASSETFTDLQLSEALEYVSKHPLPVVLKADGLAAGKGVLISTTREEALAGVKDILESKKFGEAGAKLVVETFLDGIEMSVFVVTNGKGYVILPSAKDYKRIGEGDTGLNTGGMGSVSPLPFEDAAFMEKVERMVVAPSVKGLEIDALDFTGFLFIGLMIVGDTPYVLEYNVRMGDPETQTVMQRVDEDLLELLWKEVNGDTQQRRAKIKSEAAVTVVVASKGYPEAIKKGIEVEALPLNTHLIKLFHAGTDRDSNGVLRTSGGRVFAVTALGTTVEEARNRALNAAKNISFDGATYRKDIALDILNWTSLTTK